jgi:hypothetical protein
MIPVDTLSLAMSVTSWVFSDINWPYPDYAKFDVDFSMIPYMATIVDYSEENK